MGKRHLTAEQRALVLRLLHALSKFPFTNAPAATKRLLMDSGLSPLFGPFSYYIPVITRGPRSRDLRPLW